MSQPPRRRLSHRGYFGAASNTPFRPQSQSTAPPPHQQGANINNPPSQHYPSFNNSPSGDPGDPNYFQPPNTSSPSRQTQLPAPPFHQQGANVNQHFPQPPPAFSSPAPALAYTYPQGTIAGSQAPLPPYTPPRGPGNPSHLRAPSTPSPSRRTQPTAPPHYRQGPTSNPRPSQPHHPASNNPSPRLAYTSPQRTIAALQTPMPSSTPPRGSGSPNYYQAASTPSPSRRTQPTPPLSHPRGPTPDQRPSQPPPVLRNTTPNPNYTFQQGATPAPQAPLPAVFRVLELNDTITYHTQRDILYNLQPGSWQQVVVTNAPQPTEVQMVCFVRHPPSAVRTQPAHTPSVAPHEALFNRFYRPEDQQDQQQQMPPPQRPGQIQQVQPQQQQAQAQTAPQLQQPQVQQQQQQQIRPAIKYRCREPDGSYIWREIEDIHLWCLPGYWSVTHGSSRTWTRLS